MDEIEKRFRENGKLRAAIIFFISKIPDRLDRVKLCKHLFYSDGHFFQKTGRTITGTTYLHVEGSPQPLFFNELLHDMVQSKEVLVTPVLVSEKTESGPVMVVRGLGYQTDHPVPDLFTREEKKVLTSIALLFNGDLTLETRYYPNLYQQYAQTGLYEEIVYRPLAEGIRPHLSWKAWANKVFRLLWE